MENFTISVWLKVTGNNNGNRPYNSYICFGHSWNHAYNYPRRQFDLGDASVKGSWYPQCCDITDDNWHHVVVTYTNNGGIGPTNGTERLYVDGSEKSNRSISQPLGFEAQFDSLSVGACLYDTQYFTGSIDDVRLYNRPLLPEEVRQLFQQERTIED